MVREITIRPVLNGFVCQVGCQTVVVGSIDVLVDGIRDYYRNPEATEKKWIECAINKTMNGSQEAAQSAPRNLCATQEVAPRTLDRIR